MITNIESYSQWRLGTNSRFTDFIKNLFKKKKSVDVHKSSKAENDIKVIEACKKINPEVFRKLDQLKSKIKDTYPVCISIDSYVSDTEPKLSLIDVNNQDDWYLSVWMSTDGKLYKYDTDDETDDFTPCMKVIPSILSKYKEMVDFYEKDGQFDAKTLADVKSNIAELKRLDF